MKYYNGAPIWGDIVEEILRRFQHGDSIEKLARWLRRTVKKKAGK